MFCPNCGKDVQTGAMFCESCGAPTSASPADQQYAQAPPGQYRVPPSQYQVPPPAYGQPAPYGMPPYGAVPMKSTGITVILALIPALFGFMGLGHMYVGKITEGIIFLIVGWVLIFVGIFTLFIPTIIFGIWQVYNAYNKTNQYNAAVQQTGRAPW